MAADHFDPEGMLGPAALRVTGWAWYRVGEMLFLVGSDDADEARRPALSDGSTPPPFWRLSELAHVVEHGDSDPWRERVAHELLVGVMNDLAADGGFDWGRRREP